MSAVQNLTLEHTVSVDAPVFSATRTRILYAVTFIAIISFIMALYFSLVYTPTDIDQGNVQRLFYTHISTFSGAFCAFLATVFGGILYLITKNSKWDTLALAGVETGFVLAAINLITGSIWARPIWNTWWTWDPRLTSAAIMLLTYAAYFMLRSGIENVDTKRRFASVYGILAFSTVLVTLFIIRLRPDTIHPTVIGESPQNAQGGFSMDTSMITALGVVMTVWCVFIPIAMMWWRIRLEAVAEFVRAKRAQVVEG